jgi:large subunit ribosomal protein L23
MELNVYDIIKKAVITNKSVDLFKKYGKVTFEVNKNANKIMVRNAVEKIWNVEVANVRIVNIPGKERVFARKSFVTPDRKKALVTLKKGYKIEIPGMIETMGAVEPSQVKDASEGK